MCLCVRVCARVNAHVHVCVNHTDQRTELRGSSDLLLILPVLGGLSECFSPWSKHSSQIETLGWALSIIIKNKQTNKYIWDFNVHFWVVIQWAKLSTNS